MTSHLHPPVTVFAPTPDGGHPEYVHELMTAMAQEEPDRELRLVTSARLHPRFRSTDYVIEAELPVLTGRAGSRGLIRWVTDRVLPGRRPESVFLAIMKRRPGQVVHLQEYHPLLMPAHIRKLRAAGHRVAVTVHNVDPHDRPGGVPLTLYRRWQIRAWRRADLLLVHSEANAAALRHRLGPLRPRVEVTPHGIWSTPDDPQPPAADSRRLLFFGVLRDNKGLDVLLESLPLLPQVHLTIAGETPDPAYARTISDLVAAAPRSQVTWRAGFVEPEGVAPLFTSSSAVVLPYTRFEAQSGVLHLAIAHGRPVVVTDVGGMAETVRRFDCGEVVASGDPRALAEGIARLWEPGRLARAAAGTTAARQQLSWRSTARRTLQAYDGIALAVLS